MFRHKGTRSSRPPSSKVWDGALLSVSGLVANATTAGWILDPPSCIDDFDSPTVIRLLVAVTVFNASAAAAPEYGAFGIYVASGDEDDIGIPSIIWDPVTDQRSDWMYRWNVARPAGAPASQQGNGSADILIDVRTKRKIPRGAGLLGVFQAENAGTFAFAADVRALIISG